VRESRGLFQLLRSCLSPRVGVAVALWRVEAWVGAPLALVLVATLGRWGGVFAMAGITAAHALFSLLLLDGDNALHAIREWLGNKRWGSKVLALAAHSGRRWLILSPLVVLLLSPFWRILALLLLGFRRWELYLVGVGGSVPHALIWTGLVAGSIWDYLRPAIQGAF